MTRFKDMIGYELPATRVHGVWVPEVVERELTGDVLNALRSLDPSDGVNDNIRLQNRISVLGDAFALENFMYVKYVKWNGRRWIATSVEVQRPRLIISLGGVYDGNVTSA